MLAFPFLQYNKQKDKTVGQVTTINPAFPKRNDAYHAWTVIFMSYIYQNCP